jgi:hypothetical protein
VPFDPKTLMQSDWRERLAPTFSLMPELQRTVRASDSLSGVYIADVLLLPEYIELKGDTVILMHQIAPDDENFDVKIEGHYALFIFTIGESTKMFRIKNESGLRGTISIHTSGHCLFRGQAWLFSRIHYSCIGTSVMEWH